MAVQQEQGQAESRKDCIKESAPATMLLCKRRCSSKQERGYSVADGKEFATAKNKVVGGL